MVDGIIIVILILFVKYSAQYGFVRAIIKLLGNVVAFYVTMPISSFLSNMVFSKFVRPNLVKFISEKISEMGSDLVNGTMQVLDEFPLILREMVGIDIPSLAGYTNGYDIAVAVTDSVLAKPCTMFIQMTLFSLIFGLFALVIDILSKFFTGIRRIPVIGPINAFLGGIIGVFEGIITLFIIVSIAQIFLIATDNKDILNILSQTIIYEKLVELNPVLGWLGIG